MFWPQQSDLDLKRTQKRPRAQGSFKAVLQTCITWVVTKEFQEQLSINFIKFDPVTCPSVQRERKNLVAFMRISTIIQPSLFWHPKPHQERQSRCYPKGCRGYSQIVVTGAYII